MWFSGKMNCVTSPNHISKEYYLGANCLQRLQVDDIGKKRIGVNVVFGKDELCDFTKSHFKSSTIWVQTVCKGYK